MEINKTTIFAKGETLSLWGNLTTELENSIQQIKWPIDSNRFILKPQRKSNGVTAIKPQALSDVWAREVKLAPTLGPVDFYHQAAGVAVEWETGNISSSHRSMNKLALNFLQGNIRGGILIIPEFSMGKYLTDRVATFEELEPFFDLWRSIQSQVEAGVWEVWAIKQDFVSDQVPLLPKKVYNLAVI